ncbi:MAG: hypothetical protein ACXU86_15685 [Archangium sp.]
MVVLLMLLAGCGSANLGTRPTPSPGAKPAVKKELPWLTVPGGRMKTTLFYGPWQCRQQFMNECQMKCASEGHVLKGCIWLADLKFDWEGSLVLLPVDVEAGSRYGIYHCCCNYTELSKQATRAARDKWESRRNTFRQQWSQRFGDWPGETGKSWPGHHSWDIKHGGDPVDPNNIFPAEPGVHDIYTREYPGCYDGKAPWNTVGADLPYTDN